MNQNPGGLVAHAVLAPSQFPPKEKARRRSLWLPLGLSLGALLVFVGGCAVAVLLLIQSSDAYNESAAFAASHALVTARLGTPVKATGVPLGSVTRNGDFGQAQLSFDLEGPRGRARVHVSSHRDGTRWLVDRAVLAVGAETISLRAGQPDGVER